jgi:hypothetical protein
LSALRTSRLYPQDIPQVLISDGDRFDPRVIGARIIMSKTTTRINCETFRLLAQCFDQLCHRVPVTAMKTSNTNFLKITLPSKSRAPKMGRYVHTIYPPGCSVTNVNIYLIIITIIIIIIIVLTVTIMKVITTKSPLCLSCCKYILGSKGFTQF